MANVLIIGLGLIGGSYAKGLSKSGYDVYAIDPDKNSLYFALEQRAILDGSDFANPELISNADIIIFCTYPKLILEFIEKNQHLFKTNAVITDVCGVKCSIVYEIEKILRPDIHFVASHPMAGKEVSGFINSDENIFKKANFIITPTENSSDFAIHIVNKLAEDLKFNSISSLSPLEHDKAIGFLSQLTHVIAVSLMNCRDDENFVKYTGDSFRDLTRIAMINENLWSELFFENKDMLIEEIDNFTKEMNNLKSKLASDDVDGLKELFISSTNRRKKYLKNR